MTSSFMSAAEHLPDDFNAAEWLVGRHVVEGRGGRIAIVADGEELTYAELDERVRRFASLLESLGIHAGERVAFVLPDVPSLVVGFLGALARGAVAVPINTLLKTDDHLRIVADCCPRLVIVETDAQAAALASSDAVVLTRAQLEERLPERTAAYARTHRDAFAFLLYSSGTTGEPKGVLHLQHDIWVCCATYGKQVLRITENDRTFSIAKLFFAYGLGNSLYFPFSVGATAVLFAGRPTPDAVLEQVRRHRPTLFFGVPTAYGGILAAGGADRETFSSVRQGVSAGEALPAPLFERFRESTGVEILDGIGSTEICHIFLSNRAGEVVPGSSGTVVPGYELSLRGEDGAYVADGQLGQLHVRGDSTMALYWNKHEATKRTLTGEWIATGDLYQRDEAGHYVHAGRSDDMIKAGGIWVSPVEVEATLLRHEAVLECAVIGERDDEGLEKPHAFVVLKEHIVAAGMDGTLRDHTRLLLAHYKCPRRFTFVASLPKTATGKIQRFVLRAR
jgi:benzoate-CoA ligase family protein